MKLLIAFLLITYVYSQTFSAGSDAIANTGEFKFRKIGKYWASIAGLYSSVAVDAAGSSTSGSVNASVILMGVHVGVPLTGNVHAPFNWMATIKGSGTYSVDASLLTSLTADVGASLIATAFSHIDERKSDGTLVRRVNLRDIFFTGTAGDNGKLTFASFKSTSIFPPSQKVEIHYFVAEELGEVTFEGVTTVASPKTLESFIIISDWKYASNDNHLVLVSGVATGSLTGTASLTARSTLSSGSGENKVYAYFSDEARIDGKTRKVVVTTKNAANVSISVDNSIIQAKLDAFYKGSITYQIVESSFSSQPGSQKIVYDPALGSGEPMQNGVSKVVFFAVAYLIALLI